MINDYRNAMDRIKADDEFKEQLLKRLAAEQEKPKKVVKLTPPAASKHLPLVASLASAAVLALLPRCWYCRC